MTTDIDLAEALLNTWKTSNQISIFLLKNIPKNLRNSTIPGKRHQTIGMLGGHLHNVRCMWIKMIGKGEVVKVPERVDLRQASCKDVTTALNRSSLAMIKLIKACLDNGGRLPARPAWLNFPNDVVHLVSYFIAHEAHHRGQIILVARQLNHRFPPHITNGLWQWTKRLKESNSPSNSV